MNINEDIRFEDFIISFKTVWDKKIICIAGALLMFAIGIILTWNSDVSNYYSSYVSVSLVELVNSPKKLPSLNAG